MNHSPRSLTDPHLVWVYAGYLTADLYAAQHLDTTQELRGLDWRVTLIAAGPTSQQSVRGVEVLCLPKPHIYFVRQIIYHAKVIRLIMRQQPKPDIILFHQDSLP